MTSKQLCKKIKKDLIKHFGTENISIVPDFNCPDTYFRAYIKGLHPAICVKVYEDFYDLGDFGVSEPFLVADYFFESISISVNSESKQEIDKLYKELISTYKKCEELKPILKEIIHA